MSEISELFTRCVDMHRAGELGVAAQGYAAILQADPSHADAWHLAGLVAHQSGRTGNAVEYISRAIELNSRNAEYHSNLAAVLMAGGNWSQALASAETAIGISDQSAASHFQRGRALARLGETQSAAESLTSARERGFDPALVLQELGSLFQAAGQLETSVQALEESLQHNSLQPSVWLTLSRFVTTGQYRFSAAQLGEMKRLLEQSRIELDQARISFAIAAHCDRQADYAQAFEHLQYGNERARWHLNRHGHVYDAERHSRRIDDLIAVFTKEFLQSLQSVSASSRPIVVVGMPRSGTSLIEQILASHPDVAGGGELSYWTLAFDRQFGCDGLRAKSSAITTEWRTESATMYDALLRQISPHALRVVDKMPGNYQYLGLIATAFPQASIIHCCRDPRDTCLSCFAQLFDDEQLQLATSDLSVLAQRYRDYDRLMQHWHQVLPGRITDVRYEELVENPEPGVRRFVAACRLPWSNACLISHRNRQSIQTASAVQVRQPMYTTSKGRWVRYRQQLQPLSDHLGDCIGTYEARTFQIPEVSDK